MYKHVKLIGALIGVILFIVLIAGLTYAYVSWRSDNINMVVNSKCFNILYTKGTDIGGSIIPSDDYTGGATGLFKVNIDKSCDIRANGKLYLNTSSKTSNNLYRQGLLNYSVLKGNDVIANGNITSSGEIEIDLGELAKSNKASTNYSVYVWIDRNLVENSDVFSGYSGNIRVEASQIR